MSARHYAPAEERFWDRVQKRGPDECWPWIVTNRQGYGAFRVNGRTIAAHRFSWLLAGGSLPEGLELDHLCRNRACQNPRHLDLVTRRVNILRGEGQPAKNARATHCVNGHLLSGANLRFRSDGTRRCAACSVVQGTATRAAHPEQRKARYARYREAHREERNAYMRARRLAAYAAPEEE